MLVLLSVLLDFVMFFFSSSNNSCLGGEKNPNTHRLEGRRDWVFFFHLMVSNFLGLLLGPSLASSCCSPPQPLPARPRS